MTEIAYYDFPPIIENQGYAEEFIFEDQTGAPIDLSGFDIRMHIYPGNQRQGTPIEMGLDNGISVSGDDLNILNIMFSKELSLQLRAVQFYDILLEKDGVNMYVFEGKIPKKTTKTR